MTGMISALAIRHSCCPRHHTVPKAMWSRTATAAICLFWALKTASGPMVGPFRQLFPGAGSGRRGASLERPAGYVSRSIEETRRPEIGELSPLPSTYDLVSHHRAQERRHRHAAMGDGDIVAGRPRHRSNGGQMVAGDRPEGDAHRLRFDLAD